MENRTGPDQRRIQDARKKLRSNLKESLKKFKDGKEDENYFKQISVCFDRLLDSDLLKTLGSAADTIS